MKNPLVKITTIAVAAGTLLSGCSLANITVQDLPLPGGADLGAHPYTVTIEIDNVLSLVKQGAVKVNDVPVGRVDEIKLVKGAWHAEAVVRINDQVRLPANAMANIEQSSLLGEHYIRLAAPAKPSGALTDGSRIPLAQTGRNPETEEVLGALSMLVNGGGLHQLRTITRELNKALSGNETEIRELLGRLNVLTGTLDTNKTTITAALDGLNRLSATVAARTGQVDTVLDHLAPGLKVLDEQREQFLELLRRLDHLSDTVKDVLVRTTDDTVADLKALAPTLRKIADSGRDLPKALQVLLTFPYTDQVMGAIKGDYLNLFATVIAADGNDCVNAPVQEPSPVQAKRLAGGPGPEPLPPGPHGACPKPGEGGAPENSPARGPGLPLPPVPLPGTPGPSGGSVLPDLDGE